LLKITREWGGGGARVGIRERGEEVLSHYGREVKSKKLGGKIVTEKRPGSSGAKGPVPRGGAKGERFGCHHKT